MPNTITSLLTSDQVFASTLLILAVDQLGLEFLQEDGDTWTPATFRQELSDRLGTVVPDDTLGKLMAAISVLRSDVLYRSLPSFLFTVHGLLGDGTDWCYAEPFEVAELAWAVMEAMLIWPPEEGDLFDPQIVAYCRMTVKRAGLLSPPAVLSFAREDAVYGDLGQFGDDILREQSDRTREINEELELRQAELYRQLESIRSLGRTATELADSVRQELRELAGHDQWR